MLFITVVTATEILNELRNVMRFSTEEMVHNFNRILNHMYSTVFRVCYRDLNLKYNKLTL